MRHHVLVTGARAKTGAPLVERLRRRPDVALRAGSSDPERLGDPTASGVRFSWDDPSDWPAAVAGLDALFIVRPDRADAPGLVSRLLASTPERTHVVLLSEIDGGYFTAADWAKRVEQAVTTSGRTWTLLQPSWFMQVFTDPRFFLEDVAVRGTLRFVSEGRPVSWIDARDIAAVAEHALLEPGHHGRVYELTGPEAITLGRTATLLGEAARRPVTHVEISMDDALAGTSGFARDNDYGALDRVRRGMAGTTTDDVEQVTGARPHTFEEFLRDHGDAFRQFRADPPS